MVYNPFTKKESGLVVNPVYNPFTKKYEGDVYNPFKAEEERKERRKGIEAALKAEKEYASTIKITRRGITAEKMANIGKGLWGGMKWAGGKVKQSGSNIKWAITNREAVSKYLPEATRETLERITHYVPGGHLAKGLGISVTTPEAKKWQQQANKRQTDLENALLLRLKKAREDGDTERYNRLATIGKDIDSPKILDKVLEDAPTDIQVVASAAELSIYMALGYKSYLPKLKAGFMGIQRIKEIARQTPRAAGVLGKFVKPVVKGTAESSAFFAALEAKRKDATEKSIIESSKRGALFGLVFTAGAIVVSEAIRFGVPHVKNAWRTKVLDLERRAMQKVATPGMGKNPIENMWKHIGDRPQTLKQKWAGEWLKTTRNLETFKAKWIDVLTPAKKYESILIDKKGKPLSEGEKLYRNARLTNSIADARATRMKLGRHKAMDKFSPEIKRKATAWIENLNQLDRAKLGQKVPGGKTWDQLSMNALKMKLRFMERGEWKQIQEIQKITNQYTNGLLKVSLEGGLLRPEELKLLKEAHPNYLPHDVILNLAERKYIPVHGGNFNVPKTQIQKAIGSVKDIRDPLVSLDGMTDITMRMVEKNRIMNQIVSANNKWQFAPGIKQIGVAGKKDFLKPQAGYEAVQFFKGGTRVKYQVPMDLGVMIKGLDTPVSSKLWRWATTPQRYLKKFATQYNLSFAVPNKFRDEQTAWLTKDGFVDDLIERYGIKPTEYTKWSKQKFQEAYSLGGGYGSSIFKEGEWRALGRLEKSGIMKHFPIATKPFKVIGQINEKIEVSTRMEVFRYALERGLGTKDAVFVARNASIDFARMGAYMKKANDAIPFLNARIQGFVNLAGAVTRNPAMFARMQLWTAAYPTMLLHSHNRRFESYKNVSQYLKNRYWVIMFGETEGFDQYTNQPIKVPQFITIPKGEGQVLVSGPIQYYLEKADETDYRKTSEMIVDTIGSASPLEFQAFDQSNAALTIFSQFGPLSTMLAGKASGIHPFFGSSIVPEARKKAESYMHFKTYTPEYLKDIGKKLNISPAYMDFYINSWGGLTQDMSKALDITYNVVKEGKLGGHPVSETPAGTLSQLPFFRRFIREAREISSPEMEFQYEQQEKFEKEIATRKLNVNDEAEKIWIEISKQPTAQDRLNYISSLGPLPKVVEDRLKYLARTRPAVKTLRVTQSTELRARMILWNVSLMKSKGTSNKEIIEYLTELERQKIITPTVKKIMGIIRRHE